MRTIKFKQIDPRQIKKNNTWSVCTVFEFMSCLHGYIRQMYSCHFFPSIRVLNDLLIRGFLDRNVDGELIWVPFILDIKEYEYLKQRLSEYFEVKWVTYPDLEIVKNFEHWEIRGSRYIKLGLCGKNRKEL